MVRSRRLLAPFVFALLLGTAGGCGSAGTALQEPGREPVPAAPGVVELDGLRLTVGGEETGTETETGGRPVAVVESMAGTCWDFLPSTDGAWLAVTGARGDYSVWLVALDGSGGGRLAAVEEQHARAGTLVPRLVGWAADGRLVFAVQGSQAGGGHRGETGLAFYSAAPGGAARELGWLANPGGVVHAVDMSPDGRAVFIHLTGALWRMDAVNGKTALVRGGLPSHDGLFQPRLSPAGDYFVYSLREEAEAGAGAEAGAEAENGIFTLPGTGGEQVMVARNGAERHFYPEWSPDGRLLSYYAAPAGELLGGEDDPWPLAPAVEIARADGTKAERIGLPGGLKIGSYRWSPEGDCLAFVAGTADTGAYWRRPGPTWNSIWVAVPGGGGPRKVADLVPPVQSHVSVLGTAGEGRRVYYLAYREGSGLTLWLAEEGKQPVQLGDAGFSPDHPTLRRGETLFVRGGKSREEEVYRVDGARVSPVTGDGGFKVSVAVAADRLFYLVESPSEARDARVKVIELGP